MREIPVTLKMNYQISDKVNQLSPSGIRKFFDLLASTEGVISLGVGEPDFSTPFHISEAAIAALERGYTMYTSNSGIPELRQELAKQLAKDYGIVYDPKSELLITVGSSEALDLSLRAIVNPGDEVIISDPCYVAYEPCIVMAGGVPVKIPTTQANNFELSAEDVEQYITPSTKAILIGYPANPTGAVMSREKLADIADLAVSKGLLVISDEIYAKLVYGVEHTCFPSLPGMKQHTILLGGFSKAYAMTGWRIGYSAAPAEITAAMTKIHQYTMMCASTMAQVAALEALKTGESNVREMVDDYNKRRKVILKGFADMKIPCFEPKGAFYVFPSIQSTGMKSDEFAERLLTEEKVAVVPGSAFGSCGEGYVRCCYATSLENIVEALARIRRFVNKHRRER